MSKIFAMFCALTLAAGLTVACSQTSDTYQASNPNLLSSGQPMVARGTISSYDDATHILTMDGGTQYLLSDRALSLMPNGQETLVSGQDVGFNYVNQNGKKVITSAVKAQLRE